MGYPIRIRIHVSTWEGPEEGSPDKKKLTHLEKSGRLNGGRRMTAPETGFERVKERLLVTSNAGFSTTNNQPCEDPRNDPGANGMSRWNLESSAVAMS